MTFLTERQRFIRRWIGALTLGVAAVAWRGAVRRLLPDRPWELGAGGDLTVLAARLLIGVGLSARSAFAELRTEVRDDGIHVRFRPFHRRDRSWRWEEIDEIVARPHAPIPEDGRWGLRLGISGRAYSGTGIPGGSCSRWRRRGPGAPDGRLQAPAGRGRRRRATNRITRRETTP